jgi:antitoxin VapB
MGRIHEGKPIALSPIQETESQVVFFHETKTPQGIDTNPYRIYTISYIIYRGVLVAISIRNPKAEQLAREVAEQSGESLTQAIINSLEERLDRLKGRRSATNLTEEILRISQRCSALPELDRRSPDEILDYDSRGVPK